MRLLLLASLLLLRAVASAAELETVAELQARPFVDAATYINRALVTLESDKLKENTGSAILSQRVHDGKHVPSRLRHILAATNEEIQELEHFRLELGIPSRQLVPTAANLKKAAEAHGLSLDAAQSVLEVILHQLTLRRTEIEALADAENAQADIRDFYAKLDVDLLQPAIVDAAAQLATINKWIAERDEALVASVGAAAAKIEKVKAKALDALQAHGDGADDVDACEARYTAAWCAEQCQGEAMQAFGNGAHECRWCFTDCARPAFKLASDEACLAAVGARLEAEASEFPSTCDDAATACDGASSGKAADGFDEYTKNVCKHIGEMCCARVALL